MRVLIQSSKYWIRLTGFQIQTELHKYTENVVIRRVILNFIQQQFKPVQKPKSIIFSMDLDCLQLTDIYSVRYIQQNPLDPFKGSIIEQISSKLFESNLISMEIFFKRTHENKANLYIQQLYGERFFISVLLIDLLDSLIALESL